MIKTIARSQTQFYFDNSASPVATITSGEEIIVETQDAHGGTVTDESVIYTSLNDSVRRLGGVNPITGPIAVTDVRSGDHLSIEILSVIGAPITGYGYMATTPTLHPSLAPESVICRRNGDFVDLPTHRGIIQIPYMPFIGTIGIAPNGQKVESFQHRRDILGNVDMPDICAGSTVVLRANVEGALIFIGDAHLAQGDAEIHRSAIETQSDVLVRINKLDDSEIKFFNLPQVNTASEIGSLAPGPGHLEDLVREAYDDLALRLQHEYGLRLSEAYRLLGAVGTIRIGQVVPPLYSALAKVKKCYLMEQRIN